jgi:hypothetical protein
MNNNFTKVTCPKCLGKCRIIEDVAAAMGIKLIDGMSCIDDYVCPNCHGRGYVYTRLETICLKDVNIYVSVVNPVEPPSNDYDLKKD